MTWDERISASKTKFDAEGALEVVRQARELYVNKGRKLIHFDRLEAVEDARLLELILGRSGTLRAPTVRVNEVVIVGWSEDAYQAVFKDD